MPQPGTRCQIKGLAGRTRGGGGGGRRRARGHPRWPTAHPSGRVGSGERGYAATTRCRGNGNVSPAGGLWARLGPSPRWVRIFSITAGCSMNERRADDVFAEFLGMMNPATPHDYIPD